MDKPTQNEGEIHCAKIVRRLTSELERVLKDGSTDADLKRFAAKTATGLSNKQNDSVRQIGAFMQEQATLLDFVRGLLEAADFKGRFPSSCLDRLRELACRLAGDSETTMPDAQKLLDTLNVSLKELKDLWIVAEHTRRAAEEPDAERVKFNILFLTDFHYGAEGYQNRWRDAQQPFLESLKRLHSAGHLIDLVIFGGDLSFSGKSEEYGTGSPNGFNGFLKCLWDHLKNECGSNPILLTVPGNHDLLRPSSSSDKNQVDKLKQYLASEPIRKSIWKYTGSEERKIINNSFRDYQDWRNSNLELQEKEGKFNRMLYRESSFPGDFSYVLQKASKKLGIIGLNSAFLQFGDEDYEAKLIVEPDQLHDVCEPDGRAWMGKNSANLLITHHPIKWLDPACQGTFENDICIPGLVDVHLHGHMHMASFSEFSRQANARISSVQGPALFGMDKFYDRKNQEPKQRIHGYMVLEITIDSSTENRFRVRPRAFSSGWVDEPAPGIAVDSEGWTSPILKPRHSVLHNQRP